MAYKESKRVFIEAANECGYGGFRDIASIVYGYLEYDEFEFNNFVTNVSIKCYELFKNTLEIDYDEFYKIIYQILLKRIGFDYLKIFENMIPIIFNDENSYDIDYNQSINYVDYNVPLTISSITGGFMAHTNRRIDYGLLKIFSDIFDDDSDDFFDIHRNVYQKIPLDKMVKNSIEAMNTIKNDSIFDNVREKNDVYVFEYIINKILENQHTDDVIMADINMKIENNKNMNKVGSLLPCSVKIPVSQNIKFDLAEIINDITENLEIIKLNKKYTNNLSAILEEYICIYFEKLFIKRNIIKPNYNWLKIFYINHKLEILINNITYSSNNDPNNNSTRDIFNMLGEVKQLNIEINKYYNYTKVLIYNNSILTYKNNPNPNYLINHTNFKNGVLKPGAPAIRRHLHKRLF